MYFREYGCAIIAHKHLDTYMHITMNIEGASPFFRCQCQPFFSVSTLYFQELESVSSPNLCLTPVTATYIALLFFSQLLKVALMEQFVWLMDLWRVQAEWRSVSMECGEQCVVVAGITMMPESCADNSGTMSTQVQVS